MAYNILIVDDSPAMRRVVKRVVELTEVEVGNYFEAENGIAALIALRSNWVDLIMTDINMPDMDGEQLLLEVRKDAMLASIPLLVISTDHTDLRIGQMMKQGANGYITKPFMPAQLSGEISRLLGGVPDAGF
jgi:two-component system chemotaxis response regulator CheY